MGADGDVTPTVDPYLRFGQVDATEVSMQMMAMAELCYLLASACAPSAMVRNCYPSSRDGPLADIDPIALAQLLLSEGQGNLSNGEDNSSGGVDYDASGAPRQPSSTHGDEINATGNGSFVRLSGLLDEMERKNREYLASLALIDGASGKPSSRVSFIGQIGAVGGAAGAITPSTPAGGAPTGNGEIVPHLSPLLSSNVPFLIPYQSTPLFAYVPFNTPSLISYPIYPPPYTLSILSPPPFTGEIVVDRMAYVRYMCAAMTLFSLTGQPGACVNAAVHLW